jgi:hypothetical protein
MKENENQSYSFLLFFLPLSSEKLSSENIRELFPNRYADGLLLPNIIVLISSNEIFDYQ